MILLRRVHAPTSWSTQTDICTANAWTVGEMLLFSSLHADYTSHKSGEQRCRNQIRSLDEGHTHSQGTANAALIEANPRVLVEPGSRPTRTCKEGGRNGLGYYRPVRWEGEVAWREGSGGVGCARHTRRPRHGRERGVCTARCGTLTQRYFVTGCSGQRKCRSRRPA